MRNVPIPPERRRDPLAWTLHPNVSRDPERTPMQWEPGPGAGFTAGEPWLPIAADADVRNVAAQRADRSSLLWLYRDLLSLRRERAVLRRGRFQALPAPEGVFAFERRLGAERALVALNFGDAPARVDLGGGAPAAGLRTTHGAPCPRTSPGSSSRRPRAWCCFRAERRGQGRRSRGARPPQPSARRPPPPRPSRAAGSPRAPVAPRRAGARARAGRG